MKRFNLALFLGLLPVVTCSQTIHGPVQIVKILNDSKLMYEIAPLEAPEIDAVKYPAQLDHGFFVKKLPDGSLRSLTYAEEYQGNKEYFEDFVAAESAFVEKQWAEARSGYMKVLAIAPNQSQVMTFIGQTFASEGNDSGAAEWYKKAVAVNYYDYMAHWFLADVHSARGEKDTALKEVLTAAILNRNNVRLFQSLDRILGASGLKYNDWQFTPRYEVQRLEKNKVSIKFSTNHAEWMPYALCKAVWAYEPGYRDSMVANGREHPTVIEEKECLANVIMGLQLDGKQPKDLSLQVAQTALGEKMFAEYLIYEVILPRNPRFAFLLSHSFVDSISQYILKFRAMGS